MVPALWSLWLELQSRRRCEQRSTARVVAALLELVRVLACEQLCEQCAGLRAWRGVIASVLQPLATAGGALLHGADCTPVHPFGVAQVSHQCGPYRNCSHAGRRRGGVPRSALQEATATPSRHQPKLATRRLSSLSAATQRFLDDAGCTVPVIKGPMYPGSNPELVAAVERRRWLGVVQPISLTHFTVMIFVKGYN